MTRFEKLTNEIQTNLERLKTMDAKAQESRELARKTGDLLIQRQFLTIGQEIELVEV